MAKLARPEQWVSGGAVTYRFVGPQGAPSVIELQLDYAKAPVPEHFYVADYFFITEEEPGVLLTFGKLDTPATDRLRSKIEIYFPPPMFVRQLWASSRTFHERLRAQVGSERCVTWARLLEAPKVQTLQSNNTLMVLSEGECLLDFFYISPKDLYLKTRKRELLGLEALVRIIVGPVTLLSFLDACQPLASALSPKYEAPHENLESQPAR